MKTQQQQCTTTITVRLCLLVALLAMAGTANAFTTPSFTTKFHRVSTHRFSEPSDDAPAPVASAGDAAAAASSDAAAGQASYGTTEELPESYVRCGKCQTSFALTEEDLGVGGKGRYVDCRGMDFYFILFLLFLFQWFDLTRDSIPSMSLCLLPSNLSKHRNHLLYNTAVASNAVFAITLGFNPSTES